jgi:hypothetical protein
MPLYCPTPCLYPPCWRVGPHCLVLALRSYPALLCLYFCSDRVVFPQPVWSDTTATSACCAASSAHHVRTGVLSGRLCITFSAVTFPTACCGVTERPLRAPKTASPVPAKGGRIMPLSLLYHDLRLLASHHAGPSPEYPSVLSKTDPDLRAPHTGHVACLLATGTSHARAAHHGHCAHLHRLPCSL